MELVCHHLTRQIFFLGRDNRYSRPQEPDATSGGEGQGAGGACRWRPEDNLRYCSSGAIQLTSFLMFSLHVFIYGGRGDVCHGTFRSQRTTFRSQFPPSTMWLLGTKLRQPGLVVSIFACWTILLILFLFYETESFSGLSSPNRMSWLAIEPLLSPPSQSWDDTCAPSVLDFFFFLWYLG